MFALLVMMAAVQTRNDRPATERERSTLISNVDARKSSGQPGEDRRAASQGGGQAVRLGRPRRPGLPDVRVKTGDLAATGPGITVVASPSTRGNPDGTITDNDLQILVNGLWYAGAEAISVNGERIGTMSAIRFAGGAITVNFNDIGPPYAVVALGNEDTLLSGSTTIPPVATGRRVNRRWRAVRRDIIV